MQVQNVVRDTAVVLRDVLLITRVSTEPAEVPPKNINANRGLAGGLMWHLESDDVKKENLALRALVGSLKQEVDAARKQGAQTDADRSALLVAQQSLAYERKVNTELEEMHRSSSEKLRALRDELRAAHDLANKDSVTASQVKIEEVLKRAGWKRNSNESLDETVVRALTDNSTKMLAMQHENSQLRGHISFLEMVWNQSSMNIFGMNSLPDTGAPMSAVPLPPAPMDWSIAPEPEVRLGSNTNGADPVANDVNLDLTFASMSSGAGLASTSGTGVTAEQAADALEKLAREMSAWMLPTPGPQPESGLDEVVEAAASTSGTHVDGADDAMLV